MNAQAVRKVLAVARQLLQQLRECEFDDTSIDAEAFEPGPVRGTGPRSPSQSANRDPSSSVPADSVPAEHATGPGKANDVLESALEAVSPEATGKEARDAPARGSTNVSEETAQRWLPEAFTDAQLAEVAGLLVAAAYPDRVALQRERGNRCGSLFPTPPVGVALALQHR